MNEEIEKIRSAILKGEDANLYLHIGHFMSWFSAAEIRITMLLQVATENRDAESFELLTRGMDARIKCERLRKACKKEDLLGPNLAQRLRIFENRVIPLRNKLAHCMVMAPDPNGGIFYLSTLARLPYKAFEREQSGLEPESMRSIDLFRWGHWTCLFSWDLQPALHETTKSGKFEVENPRSPLIS